MHDRFDRFRRDRRLGPAAQPDLTELGQPLGYETLTPRPHRNRSDPDLGSDVGIRNALRGQQQRAGTLHLTMRHRYRSG